MATTPSSPNLQPSEPSHRLTRMLAQIGRALGAGQFDQADAIASRALSIDPGCVEAWRLSAVSMQMRGRHRQATEQLRKALALASDNPLVLMSLGASLHEIGDIDGALASAQRACQLLPDAAAPWFNLGRMLKLQRRPGEAREALSRALAADATHLPARQMLADVELSLGNVEAAQAHYRQILQFQPGRAKTWVSLANLRSSALTSRDVAALQRLLAADNLPAQDSAMLGFTLASAFEQQGHFADAWAALVRANALERQRLPWDAAAFHAQVDNIVAAFAKAVPSAATPSLGAEVIFITCLPRSGSSLVEQILASHSGVEGAGEVTALQEVIEAESARRGRAFPRWTADATPTDWQRMGQDYLARTEAWHRDGAHFTDKNVLNWLYAGAAMAMLPGARIVNVRRDRLENAFACFRQLFVGGSHFSYALEDITAYLRDYERLSRHWQSLFPERFFDLQLEPLVAAPEAEIRRLLQFCALGFEPACLAPHNTQRAVFTASAAQVRQPIGADAHGTWASRYGAVLDGLRTLLSRTQVRDDEPRPSSTSPVDRGQD